VGDSAATGEVTAAREEGPLEAAAAAADKNADGAAGTADGTMSEGVTVSERKG
jgi:hypothetical protein